jgi:hypothetical protein
MMPKAFISDQALNRLNNTKYYLEYEANAGRYGLYKTFEGETTAIIRPNEHDFSNPGFKQICNYDSKGETREEFFTQETLFLEAVSYDGEKWGYISDSGDWVIEPIYYKAKNFSEGFASVVVKKGKKFVWQLITVKTIVEDMKTKMVAVPAFKNLFFDAAEEFSHGLCPVRIGENRSLINTKGEIVTNFEDIGYFSNELCSIKINGKWGFINSEGKLVIEPKYLRCDDFATETNDDEQLYEGLAMVYVEPSGKNPNAKCSFWDLDLGRYSSKLGEATEDDLFYDCWVKAEAHFIDKNGNYVKDFDLAKDNAYRDEKVRKQVEKYL